MIALLQRANMFDRLAIGFVGLCVITLHVVALAVGPPAAPASRQLSVAQTMRWAAPDFDAAGIDAVRPTDAVRPISVIPVTSSAKLADIFEKSGYRLDLVRMKGEVPRLFIANMPRDLRKIRLPAQRKMVFIMTALPLILHTNELILRHRRRIEILRILAEADVEPNAEDAAWLRAMGERYGLKTLDFAALMRRVDVVPPSLALAQGAEESGWGTSRFAREGNALFGQRIFGGRRGIVPKKRDDGETYRVRSFKFLLDGVKAYAHNLNTHTAYDRFRAWRADMRKGGAHIDGYVLSATLERYSERGAGYVRSIRTIIRANGLTLFDRARLGDGVAAGITGPDA